VPPSGDELHEFEAGFEPRGDRMRILAATDFSTRSQRALRRAGLLARDRNSELTLVHVVDDDQPSDLIEVEKREAERILGEQLAAVPELCGVRVDHLVIAGDAFDGILRAAQSTKADLVVMGAHRKQLLRDIFIGTTIERVIRIGPYPILMVNSEVEQPYGNALAAVDMSVHSANAIRVSKALVLAGNDQFTLVHAFWPVAKGKMFTAGLDRNRIDEYVAGERQRAADELVAFVEASELGGRNWPLRIEEGGPLDVISSAVKELRADLLVIGSHGRSGIAKALLGSVTEEVLRDVDVDVLVVPPTR
jgi:universal stress protein E